jgi:hypothetical protein
MLGHVLFGQFGDYNYAYKLYEMLYVGQQLHNIKTMRYFQTMYDQWIWRRLGVDTEISSSRKYY